MRANSRDLVSYMSIGALSRGTGFSVDTIRYYERLGLLPVVRRTTGGHRLYDEAHVRRLRFVRRGRDLGLSLRQMRAMLSGTSGCCEDVRTLLANRLADVRRRLDELHALDRELHRLLDACGDAELSDCRLIEAMHADGAASPPTRVCCTKG